MTAPTETLGPPWTVLKLLDWSKGFFEARCIEAPRLAAELLLAHVLDVDRVRLYMEFDRPLMPDELDRYRALVKRRANREPVAYLTGTRGFWTLDLATDPRALIPRPDTEVLVEEALARIPEHGAVRVLDIGTGTGAVALAVKSERPDVEMVATDVDKEALALASENATRLGIEVAFESGDLLSSIDGDFQLILSNPPYVSDEAEIDLEVRQEPAHALFAGPDGLDVIRRLIPDAFAQLQPNGWLLFEIGYDQASAVRLLLDDAGFADISIRKDYGGNDRVACARRP